mmetsp:Transcript_58591/g.137186  ORF Transcript_58591/g.137186 Transcript_58591/m.137186 type:complete len:232 (-) Transcript_58591:1466-2161(-)
MDLSTFRSPWTCYTWTCGSRSSKTVEWTPHKSGCASTRARPRTIHSWMECTCVKAKASNAGQTERPMSENGRAMSITAAETCSTPSRSRKKKRALPSRRQSTAANGKVVNVMATAPCAGNRTTQTAHAEPSETASSPASPRSMKAASSTTSSMAMAKCVWRRPWHKPSGRWAEVGSAPGRCPSQIWTRSTSPASRASGSQTGLLQTPKQGSSVRFTRICIPSGKASSRSAT